jgi:hypothetical protein
MGTYKFDWWRPAAAGSGGQWCTKAQGRGSERAMRIHHWQVLVEALAHHKSLRLTPGGGGGEGYSSQGV